MISFTPPSCQPLIISILDILYMYQSSTIAKIHCPSLLKTQNIIRYVIYRFTDSKEIANGFNNYFVSNGLLPNSMNILHVKNKDIHSYNTKSNTLLRIHRGTVNFTNLSARVWNILTRNMNVYVPYHVFKLKFKLYLMNN